MSILIDNKHELIYFNPIQRFIVKKKNSELEMRAITITRRNYGKNEYMLELNKRICVKYLMISPQWINQYIPLETYGSFEEYMDLLKKYEKETSESIKYF